MRFLGIFFFLIASLSSAQAKLWCIDLLDDYYFAPHRGTEMDMYSQSVYQLGEGDFGTVYRTTVPNQPTVIFKEYKNPAEGFARIDSKNLELLSRVNSSDLNVRTVKVLRNMTPSRVFLENILGRSLGDIFKAPDSQVSPELKWSLYLRYTAYVRLVQEHLNADKTFDKESAIILMTPLSFDQVQGSPLFVLKVADHRQQVYLTVKPENIIVDAKTLEMIVVDPN